MESSGGGSAGGGWPEPVAMEFPAVAPSSPARVPRRIRKRMMEVRSCSSPSSVEEIEAKLKEADLRRQRFRECLTCKARPKPRSPSWSSQEEDLSQRLEAKLIAAKQKRLSLMEKAQQRLARLDELRQAARMDLETRIEKERSELFMRVESRVRKAEANRLRQLAACIERRTALKERTARSLVQRTVKENKYKERVRSVISQKRAAAEKKRLGLLEAEKRRARARFMRARRVAHIVFSQRESERIKMQEQLEDKLQRAKRQRAEYLRQRGSPRSSAQTVWNKNGDFLSRKLARYWRRFVRSKRTSLALAKSYQSLGINEKSVKSMPFEQLALRIESPATIQATKSLLDRIEFRFLLSHCTASSASPAPQNIDHLLKHLASPTKKSRSRAKSSKNTKKSTVNKPSRYAVRVVLCAYMILGHPNAVFSGRGEREISLMEGAMGFIKEFELLLTVVLDGPESGEGRLTFRGQLAKFDSSWCNYLYRFVAWKVKDARALEEDLVQAVCKLELSMMQTCKVTADGGTPQLSHDMKAIQKQVTDDQNLLREKVHHLSGSAGLDRMESALSETRSKFFQSKLKEKNNGRSHSTPVARIGSSSTSTQNSISTPGENKEERPDGHVVRSLFKGEEDLDVKLGGSRGETEKSRPTLNEILINEILHDNHGSFVDRIDSSGATEEMEIKVKVKETMEKAFWDGVMDSLRGDKPDYTQILDLVKEVRDELCQLAPHKWRREILDRIDLDILSQVFESGTQDGQYLGQILEYSLSMLRKLSSPASEEEMGGAHRKLLTELAQISQSQSEKDISFILALVKGLRFTLEEIQGLKKEVSKARIQLLEPLLQGSAGLEYLQKLFADRCGPYSDAVNSLPLTARWISLLRPNLEEEWNEYLTSLSVLSPEDNAQPLVTTLRTGSRISAHLASAISNSASKGVVGLPECTGERIDKLVRIGLLKLVSGAEGITVNSVPETLMLNALRLRSVQSEYQKIIVIATSMLVLRQILVTENLNNPNPQLLESSISKSMENLCKLLDTSPNVEIEQIVDSLTREPTSSDPHQSDSRRNLIMRMLLKSLQNGDLIFDKVSKSVYSAFRAIVLSGGGNNNKGVKLAEMSLRKVGSTVVLDRVVKSGEVLVRIAVVSGSVHGPWYGCLM